MRLRRTRAFLTAAVLVVVALPITLAFASTINEDVNGFGIFELDGTPIHQSTTVPPYAWAPGTGPTAGGGLFDSTGAQALPRGSSTAITIGGVGGTATLLDSTFLDDTTGSDLAFIGGGSKDIYDPAGNWKCTTKPVTPKDEIGHAYVAAFQLTSSAATPPSWNDHIVLYLALERGVVNGTSNAGFWLFDSNVGCDASTGNFNGSHSADDLLLFATFNGGSANIQAFDWVNGGLNAVLNPTNNVNACAQNSTNPSLCGATNLTNVMPPWDSTAILPNGFFEGGIDLTDFYVGKLKLAHVPCLNSFLADTRASGSQGNAVSSDLHDYIQGPFSLCRSSIVTTPSANTSNNAITLGSTAFDTATVSSSLVGAPAPTGNVTFQVCGPLPSAAGCAANDGTIQTVGASDTPAPEPAEPVDGSGTSVSDNFLPTSTGYWCFRSTYTPDAAATANGYTTTSEGSTNECFLVNPGPTTLVTAPLDGSGTNLHTSGPLTLGGSVTDTATVSTTVSGAGIPAPTGSVSFYVCYSATPITGCSSTSNQVTGLSDTGGVEPAEVLSGNSTTSDTYTPQNSGYYCFYGVYSGDSNYTGSHDSSSDECFQVIGPPGLKTTMYLSDEVTVTHLPNGGAVAPGSVTFTLYGPFSSAQSASCSNASAVVITGNPDTETLTAVGDDGVAHTTKAFSIPASNSGSWYAWGVTYTPDVTNSRYTNASLSCTTEQVNTAYTPPSGYTPTARTLAVS